jgi:hypothetical protein
VKPEREREEKKNRTENGASEVGEKKKTSAEDEAEGRI